MANVVITTDAERIYFTFNDYSDEAGMVSGNWPKEDVSVEMNIGNTDIFLFVDAENAGRLSFSAGTDLMVVDSVDAVAPVSNVDLKSLLDTALVITGGSSAWGGITGTLSDQTDLNTALNGKLATPTGTPDGTKYLRDDNTWQAVSGSGLTQQQIEGLI